MVSDAFIVFFLKNRLYLFKKNTSYLLIFIIWKLHIIIIYFLTIENNSNIFLKLPLLGHGLVRIACS